jgi:hypothetical protein
MKKCFFLDFAGPRMLTNEGALACGCEPVSRASAGGLARVVSVRSSSVRSVTLR